MEELSKDYAEQMKVYPVLDRKTEQGLFRVYCGDDPEKSRKAGEIIIKSNLKLVASLARRHQDRGVAFADLVQEGLSGLRRAMEKFEPERGYKFSTYATIWVRQSISRCIKKSSRTVFLPEHVINSMTKVSKKEKEFESANGRKPTDRELAAASGVCEKELARLRRVGMSAVSLQSKVGEDGDGSEFGEVVASPAADPGTAAGREMGMAALRECLSCLTARERATLDLRYGISDGRGMSVRKIADWLGIGEDRVLKAQERALEALRPAGAGERAASRAA